MNHASDKITYVISTFNEEKRIERVIRNFKPFGKVMIVDNHSADNTVAIAKSYGCDVFMNKNPGWPEDEATMQRVMAAITTEWVYWGYADELVDQATLNKLKPLIEGGSYDIISMVRKNYYYGKFCHNAFADRLNRVFKVGSIDFVGNKIHDFGRPVVTQDRIFQLSHKYHVHQFIAYNSSSYLKVMDKYTDIQAPRESKYRGLVMLLLQSTKCFITHYFINGAFKAGRPGLYLVLNMVYYKWLLSMKMYEIRNKYDVQSIEARNDSCRDLIIKTIEG